MPQYDRYPERVLAVQERSFGENSQLDGLKIIGVIDCQRIPYLIIMRIRTIYMSDRKRDKTMSDKI